MFLHGCRERRGESEAAELDGEREHFVEAKRNELEQFSNNNVWEFSSALEE